MPRFLQEEVCWVYKSLPVHAESTKTIPQEYRLGFQWARGFGVLNLGPLTPYLWSEGCRLFGAGLTCFLQSDPALSISVRKPSASAKPNSPPSQAMVAITGMVAQRLGFEQAPRFATVGGSLSCSSL